MASARSTVSHVIAATILSTGMSTRSTWKPVSMKTPTVPSVSLVPTPSLLSTAALLSLTATRTWSALWLSRIASMWSGEYLLLLTRRTSRAASTSFTLSRRWAMAPRGRPLVSAAVMVVLVVLRWAVVFGFMVGSFCGWWFVIVIV